MTKRPSVNQASLTRFYLAVLSDGVMAMVADMLWCMFKSTCRAEV